MVDKNLFPYDLAVVAIFKDEAPYLAEWLDYHLLAGVDHFYLYNNDGTDNFAQVLAPYVAANLVTSIDFPGKATQMPVYADALEKFRFTCRYMAFIDIDEFIFPKSNQSVAQVVDEILSRDSTAQALAINCRCFGSNGHEVADYSRGVLERFTRCAPDDWSDVIAQDESFVRVSNRYVKLVVNPRSVKIFLGPHIAVHFGENYSVDERGEKIFTFATDKFSADKIVVNHYNVKSREEFFNKARRGCVYKGDRTLDENYFNALDRNEIFDDGILSCRAAREKNFSLETDADRLRRVEKTLLDKLTKCSPQEAPTEFFVGKFETFLTCRALAEGLDLKINSRPAEEVALVWIYYALLKAKTLSHAEAYQFLSALPEILARPFPVCRKLKQFAQDVLIPTFREAQKNILDWQGRYETLQIQKLLQLII